ncbi:MAG: S1 RNA-binding domain-containing protein, partial [Bdellovibrionota bacterium]
PTPLSSLVKNLNFLLLNLMPAKKNIVVSRRKLLDLKKVENEAAWADSHQVGDIVEGRVTRTEQFGAFVSVADGVEGLVHVSEIGFIRLKHAADGVRVGDPVQVKILKIEQEEKRLKISFSIKAAGGANDPWTQIPQQYPVGSIVDGIVDKKADFGLFVVLTQGINGLLPKSKWRDADDAKKYEQAKKGDVIKVRIDEIKYEERKISLGLPTEADDESWREHQSQQSLGGAFAAAFAKAQSKSKQ